MQAILALLTSWLQGGAPALPQMPPAPYLERDAQYQTEPSYIPQLRKELLLMLNNQEAKEDR